MDGIFYIKFSLVSAGTYFGTLIDFKLGLWFK